MGRSQKRRCQLLCITAFVVVLLGSGCSGITPDGKLRNNREEGPESGIFSGPGGEFVIVAPLSPTAGEKKPEEDGQGAEKPE
ncbi:hypothetical protein [Desulfocastanea catecholica]